MRIAVTVCLAVLVASSALAEDLFTGVFESETRENFGSSTRGEYRLEIALVSEGRYAATIYHSGKLLGKKELITCPVESEDYLNSRPAGRAEVLCAKEEFGKPHGFIAYSENGIYVPAVKAKYANNPELVKQDGLKPGDPSLFEARQHATKYYAHVSWYFYGFRRVSP
jgi:hypothetical protein